MNQNPLQESWEIIFNKGKKFIWIKLTKYPTITFGKIWWYLSLWYWPEEYIYNWPWRYSLCKEIWYTLIDNLDNPYGTSTNHKYFLIHDDFFDRILATDQNNDIWLNIIPKYVLFKSINDISKDSISKLGKRSEIISPRHTLQRKRQKIVNNYSNKSIDDFKLIVVYPSPKLTER